jgi:hypothetical protein
MKVDLPSGGWVDIREEFSPADRRHVLAAVDFTSEGGVVTIPGDVAESQTRAFLAETILSWSFDGIPVPSSNIGGADILDTVFTGKLADWDALVEKARPLMEQVIPPNRPAASRRRPA